MFLLLAKATTPNPNQQSSCRCRQSWARAGAGAGVSEEEDRTAKLLLSPQKHVARYAQIPACHTVVHVCFARSRGGGLWSQNVGHEGSHVMEASISELLYGI